MKKFLSIALALAVMTIMSVTAFAEDGVEPAAPAGGIATAQSADGTTWNVTNDDDKILAASDTATDVNVWAEVKDNGTKVYKVDLTWGTMKFEFNSGTKWNVDTHSYAPVDGVIPGWQTMGYVDGINNKISVTNHSNQGIDATFSYAMKAENPFNINANSATHVVGNFFADNAKAVAAAGVTTVTSVQDTLLNNTISVASADNGGAGAGTAVTGDVFFAFSGVPDQGTGATLKDFTKVGVITVTIAVPVV